MSNPRAQRHPKPSRLAAIAAAVGAGLGGGLLGTALHAHAIYASTTVLPVGAVAALVLIASLGTWVGLWSRNSWLAVLTGGVCYATAGVLSIPHDGYGLISGNEQGLIWIYGIAIVTPLAALLCYFILRRSDRLGG